MIKKTLASLLVFTAAAASADVSRVYRKNVNVHQLAGEVHTATGYWLMRTCSTCTTQGYIVASSSTATLTFYSQSHPELNQSSATVNSTQIDAVVAAHVPKPLFTQP